MARMFPERLPQDVDSDAERRVFHEFKSQFGDDFVVFARARQYLVVAGAGSLGA